MYFIIKGEIELYNQKSSRSNETTKLLTLKVIFLTEIFKLFLIEWIFWGVPFFFRKKFYELRQGIRFFIFIRSFSKGLFENFKSKSR